MEDEAKTGQRGCGYPLIAGKGGGKPDQIQPRALAAGIGKGGIKAGQKTYLNWNARQKVK